MSASVDGRRRRGAPVCLKRLDAPVRPDRILNHNSSTTSVNNCGKTSYNAAKSSAGNHAGSAPQSIAWKTKPDSTITWKKKYGAAPQHYHHHPHHLKPMTKVSKKSNKGASSTSEACNDDSSQQGYNQQQCYYGQRDQNYNTWGKNYHSRYLNNRGGRVSNIKPTGSAPGNHRKSVHRPPPVHRRSNPKMYRPVVVRPPSTVHHIRAAFSGQGALKILCVKPLLIQIDNFFAPSRCKRVVEFTKTLNAFTYDAAGVEHGERKARTSTGMWMSEEEHLNNLDIKYMNESLANLVGFPEKNCEPLHAVKYVGGQEYWPHNDFIENHKNMPCGGRVATMLVYLTSCADGGATNFPLLNVTVHPKPGSVVLWYNVLPTGDASHVMVDERMLHAGMPVGPLGEKMIMCKWVHPYEFTH